MFSQQDNYKSINFLLLAFSIFLCSCGSYIIGNVKVISQSSNKKFNVSYNKFRSDVIFIGSIDENKYIEGKLLTAKQLKSSGVGEYLKIIPNKNGKYDFSYVRLAEKGSNFFLDCFITQNIPGKIHHGGRGLCHASNGETFDIIVESYKMVDKFIK